MSEESARHLWDGSKLGYAITQLAAHTGDPVISTEHGPWVESVGYPDEAGETHCQRCGLRSKFFSGRECEPHIVYKESQPSQSVKVETVRVPDVDDLKDRLVAASEAVANQDDRAAQAIIGETLRWLSAASAAQPEQTAQERKPLTDEQWLELLLREADSETLPLAAIPGESIQTQGRWVLLRAGKKLKELVERAHGIKGE